MDESLETLESLRAADWYNKWLINHFSEYLKGDILEVGCGIGNFSNRFKKFGAVVAVDINKKYIAQVKKQGINAGFGDIEKGKYFFTRKKFDTVVCLNVLEHIKNDDKALNNLINLLKPHGYLILLVPSHKLLFGEIDKAISHYRRYEKDELVKKFKDFSVKINFLKRLNLIGGIGWFISGRIIKTRKVDKNSILIFNLLGPVFVFLEKFFEPAIGTSLLLIAQKSKT